MVTVKTVGSPIESVEMEQASAFQNHNGLALLQSMLPPNIELSSSKVLEAHGRSLSVGIILVRRIIRRTIKI